MAVQFKDEIQRLSARVRDIPDFPKPGIIFKDITPILADAELFALAVDMMAAPWLDAGINKIAAIDARGFILGAAMAYRLQCGFVPVRKKGKLPWKTVGAEYDLEYGSNALEMHCDAVSPGERVLLVDDLLATGGTAKAATEMLKQLGIDVVGITFLVELSFLNGRQLFTDPVPYSLIKY